MHKLKLKDTGAISYYLGCDFFRDSDRILHFAPRKHIEKMASSYESMFRSKPSAKVHSPLEKSDHLELDTSEFLDAEETQKYCLLLMPCNRLSL